jgi:sugar O-acyltransferase (sialic acid O-acetyltransferase NeuD family)
VTTTLLIFGAGGHGRVVADAALLAGLWTRVLASDRDLARCVGELLPGVPAFRPEEAMAAAKAVHVAIGNAASREKEVATLAAGVLATVAHPSSSVSQNARVGAGCFIAAQAVVGPGACLGTSVIVNHGAVVDHDVAVGDFSHIAPLAALGGGAQIGQRVLVGSGAMILPGVRVCNDAVIGAGAVVADHLTEPGVYAGVPARRLK